MHHSVGNGGNRTLVYDGKIAGLYDLEETLGSGHFAVVKLARHVFTGEKVAVKVIDKTKLDEVSRAHLFQEVRCMKLVQHPNVVRLYEVIDTQTKLYLILELGDGGDLYDYIMKHEGGLSENLAREYFRQIVRAISYCHQLHVVHRDLKPENVVFFEKLGVVKLTDFGFSNKFCPGQKLETSCGSLAYSAPEILLGDSYDAPAVDIWSLGVILYMLVCGQPPFEKANDSETLTMIMDCKYTMPAHVSSGCRRLISMMLVREPEKRATLSQIASDTWLIQGAQQEIVPEYLPLVSREQVSEDDHTLIINKMVSGNIATKEEILEALDRNEYNHITATYFLLAERKLRQQRQEQIQKRRPELSLPVSSSSRLSPRSRIQGINRDTTNTNESNNLLVPPNNQLCTPRTPGAETTAGGRSRKCSIVQEEDDEDEISGCATRDELATPLNRRGSRSEGRINIAIQDRVESERLKKEKESGGSGDGIVKTNITTSITTGNKKGLENISGIKIINKNTNNVRMRLGVAGNRTPPLINIEKKKSESNIETLGNTFIPFSAAIASTTDNATKRKCSVDQGKFILNSSDTDVIQTKVLTDSSTIQIPLTTSATNEDNETNLIPKYKTMPSPTRLPPRATLNEIFEEGSSDTSSTTTTPRPITRNTNHHFTTSRNVTGAPQRKSKFHKTRTPSCSSSDASDDDSESRKKRGHKIVDVSSKPLQSQRRDSHDDSSDSQDQGNAPSSSGGGGSTSSYLVYSTTKPSNQDSNSEHQTQQQNDSTSSNTKNSILSLNPIKLSINTESDGYCDKTDRTHYRRHRNGRKRAGETRLRESQSLNRITEVQETIETSIPSPSALGVISNSTPVNHANCNNYNNSNGNNNNINQNNNNFSNNILSNDYVNGTILVTSMETTTTVTPVTTPTTITKPKGLSARLFQGFIRKNDFNSSQTPTLTITSPISSPINNEDINSSSAMTMSSISLQNSKQYSTNETDISISDNCGNMVIKNSGIDFSKGIHIKAVCDTNSSNVSGSGVINNSSATKTSSTTKKLKMLGRYFQVHKKICIPLPGLFQKGRLYKAQSCGSLVRDKVNNSSTISTTVGTATTNSNNNTSLIASIPGNKKNVLEGNNYLPLNTRHSAVLYTSTITSTTTAGILSTLTTESSKNSELSVVDTTNVVKLSEIESKTTGKGKSLRNCLINVKFLGNRNIDNESGDINQNQNKINHGINNIGKKNQNDINSGIDCNGSFSNNDSIAAVTFLKQFCSSSSAAVSALSASTAQTSLLSVSTAQISINLPNFKSSSMGSVAENSSSSSLPSSNINISENVNNDIKSNKDANLKELHELNDVPLCSSKC